MKRNFSTILLILIFLLGLGILLYPMVSDYWNSLVQTRVISDYEGMLSDMTEEDYSDEFAAADAYNAAIAQMEYPLMYYPELDQREDLLPYYSIFNLTGTGIIGYISIEKIGVELPIYHGTSEAVLNVAVGHLEGTSLPSGGPSTHSAFSAHRGLPSAKLFTDLSALSVGDRFEITVLDRLMTYEVDQILIVEPHEVEALGVIPGEDLCTLITCTPYGINSHRLLVRGHRVENAEEKPVIYVPADAVMIDGALIAPMVAIPILLVLLVILLIRYRN